MTTPQPRPSIQQMVYNACGAGCTDGRAVQQWILQHYRARLTTDQIAKARKRIPKAKQIDTHPVLIKAGPVAG
jgi:hypothetical protein